MLYEVITDATISMFAGISIIIGFVLVLEDALTDEAKAELAQAREALDQEYQVHEKELFALREQAMRDSLVMKDMRGQEVTLSMSNVLDVTWPNDLSLVGKVGHFV